MTAIRVKNLSKTFKHAVQKPGVWGSIKGLFHRETIEMEAVKNIGFDIREGEFVGFIGPNGAGKTTTLKMLSGILTPSSGEISVLGHNPQKREEEFQKRFALVMGQKNQLWWDLPPIETFELNRVIYEIPRALYEKNLSELSAILEIDHLLNIPVRKLSLGQRMKCELIAALLHSPKVLFLDEPTIGLDVISQRNIREFLNEYNKRYKSTIILTSHYMEDIRRLCDRVIIINRGNIIYDGDYKNLTEKYADTKSIEMIFGMQVPEYKISAFGKILEYRPMSARIEVPRKNIASVVTDILKELPVEDILIREESMEEIVSEIFEHHNSAISSQH